MDRNWEKKCRRQENWEENCDWCSRSEGSMNYLTSLASFCRDHFKLHTLQLESFHCWSWIQWPRDPQATGPNSAAGYSFSEHVNQPARVVQLLFETEETKGKTAAAITGVNGETSAPASSSASSFFFKNFLSSWKQKLDLFVDVLVCSLWCLML